MDDVNDIVMLIMAGEEIVTHHFFLICLMYHRGSMKFSVPFTQNVLLEGYTESCTLMYITGYHYQIQNP